MYKIYFAHDTTSTAGGKTEEITKLCADQFETSTSPPGHLTVHRAQGVGNLNVALEGWGI